MKEKGEFEQVEHEHKECPQHTKIKPTRESATISSKQYPVAKFQNNLPKMSNRV